ncbi:hypothetical protein F2P79_013584 [Pimephales promelas]|nr:hypothetical protein F2P79_013584 [Pimephales promelas]
MNTQAQTHRVLQGHPSPDAPNGHKEEVTSIFGKVIKEPGGEGEEVKALLEEERDVSPSSFTCSALIASLVGNCAE